MLSYQHSYHAGNMADVHKHALLAFMLDYMAAKPKPMTVIETHAGRGLYDLGSAEAAKTGEAATGIARAEVAGWFPADHPYSRALAAVRGAHGPAAYPGSPLIAAGLLRPDDRLHLAELHPQEYAALEVAMRGTGAALHRADGAELARSLCPPEPRRGLCLIDPSYEIKDDYRSMPVLMRWLARRWTVGVLVLWYPVLDGAPHAPMLDELARMLPSGLRLEVAFARARPGHRMTGSGLFVVNPPWGLAEEGARLAALIAAA